MLGLVHDKNRERIVVPLLGCALGILVAVLLCTLVPPHSIRDEMPGGMYSAEGLFDSAGHTIGFYAPETLPDGSAFRWTAPHATIVFPYAAHMGRHVHIGLRLSGIAAQRPPTRVKLSLNGKPYPEITVGTGFQVWSAELDTQLNPNPYLHPAHIQLDIESTPFISPTDGRELGVAVDWVALTPERSRTEIITEAVLWGLTLGVVVLVAVLRLGTIWSLVYGAGALVSSALAHLIYTPIAIPIAVEIMLVGLAWLAAAALAPKQRPAWGLALAACGLSLVFVGQVFTDWQLDDAYISYRYAWNLAHGNGLVYNPGEVVEGYTNFLWTVLAAGAIAAGLPPVGFALAMNIALSIGLVAVTYWLAQKISVGVGAGHAVGAGYAQPLLWPLLAAVLLTVDNSIVTYGARGSGMEAVLLAFLVSCSAALLWSRRRVWGGLVLALAALTRPEGLLVAVVFLLVMIGQDVLARRTVGATHVSSLRTLVPFLVVMVPYEAWRISFYGYIFPNTFYAKTGTTSALIFRGFTYWGWFFSEHILLVLLATLGLAMAALEWLPGLRNRFLALQNLGIERFMGMRTAFGLIVLGMVLYIIWIGGDYFPGWRFFVPIMTPIVVLAVEGARLVFGLLPQRVEVRAIAVTALIAAVAMGFWQQCFTGPYEVIAELTKLHSTYVDRWGSAGIWLRENTPVGTVTAVKGAGAIAYYAQRPMLDAYGLNDLHIGHLEVESMGAGRAGHDKADPQYVLNRRPDYILELENYLAPVKKQFEASYHVETHRSPTGVEIEWWKRDGIARP